MDSATATLVRPSVARLQVEVDLQKPLPNRLWINLGDNMGFWQHFEPDGPLPVYCNHCWHLGHSEVNCNIKHPELKQILNSDDQNKTRGNPKLVYRMIQKTSPEDPSKKDNGIIEVSAGNMIDITLPEKGLIGSNANKAPTADKGKTVKLTEDGPYEIRKVAANRGKSVLTYEENNPSRIQNRSEQEEMATKVSLSIQSNPFISDEEVVKIVENAGNLNDDNTKQSPSYEAGSSLQVGEGVVNPEAIFSNRIQNRFEKERVTEKETEAFKTNLLSNRSEEESNIDTSPGLENREANTAGKEKDDKTDQSLSYEVGTSLQVEEEVINPEAITKNRILNRFEKDRRPEKETEIAKLIRSPSTSEEVVVIGSSQSLVNSVVNNEADISIRLLNRFEKEDGPDKETELVKPNPTSNRSEGRAEEGPNNSDNTMNKISNRSEEEENIEDEEKSEGRIISEYKIDPPHSDDDVNPSSPIVQTILPQTSSSEGEKHKPKSQKKHSKCPVGRSNIRTRSSNPPKSQ